MQPVAPSDLSSSPKLSVPDANAAPGGMPDWARGTTPAAPGDLGKESALRGLQILQGALAVMLLSALLGGAVRAYLMTQVLGHHGSAAASSAVLSGFFGIWQLVFFGTAVAELVALAALKSGPVEARVAEPARTAMIVQGIALLLSVFSTAARYILPRLGEAHSSQMYLYIGYADTLLNLVGTVLTVDVLLRLRRYAAPATAVSDGSLRAGVIAALLIRTIVAYSSYGIIIHFFEWGGSAEWVHFALLLPFNLLFYGLMLWLIQATTTAVQTAEQRDAAGMGLPAGAQAPAGAADTGATAMRNILLGGLWFVGGSAVTALTYQNASGGGGRYVVAYGAIAAGLVQLIRGLTQLGGQGPRRP